MTAERPSAPRLALATFLLLALVALTVALRYAPPAPKPISAPEREFSADRAHARLAEILGDGAPHPTGTEANATARARVIAELSRLGYAPEVQEALVCPAGRVCARVHNIVAHLAGTAPGGLVLLAAHYDSVGAGPGASDDGSGVAALLEIARALHADPPARSSVTLLVDDGEELGLLGAEAFEAASPLARDVRVVVNLEARGTTGPSCMFETNRDNAWLIDVIARAIPRPVTSSLFYAVYKALPNDTDVSVFKRHGLQALNFAFIGRPAQYHTPLDDLAHADRGSLQHHGDNALSMVRALANVDLANTPPGDAVWFDVFASRIVSFPEGAATGLAILASLLVLTAIAVGARAYGIAFGEAAGGAGAMPAVIAASTLLGSAIVAGLHAAGALPSPWIAHPLPTLAALSTLAVAAAFAATAAFARRASPWALWAGTWIVWTICALVLAFLSPSVSFLFLVPALTAGIFGHIALALRSRVKDAFAIAALPPILAAAILWLPILNQLYDALGLHVGAVFALTAGIAATAVTPVLATLALRWRARLAAGTFAATLVASVVAIAMPPFSAESPARVSLVYDGTRGALGPWNAGSASRPEPAPEAAGAAVPHAAWKLDAESEGWIPASLRAALEPGARSEPMAAWMPKSMLSADAPDLALAGPEAEILTQSAEGSARRARVRLRSTRGAPWLEVHVPPGSAIATMEVSGAIPAESRGLRVEAAGFRGLRVVGAFPLGVELDITVRGAGAAQFIAIDVSPGLPAEAAPLVRARGTTAVPSGLGDRTIAGRLITL